MKMKTILTLCAALIFAGNVHGQSKFNDLQIMDDKTLILGTDSDFKALYDEATDNRVEWTDSGDTLRAWFDPATGNFHATGNITSGGTFTDFDTEAELESLLTDVTDVFTDNDGALNDDDVTDDNVETMATAGGSGTAPLSDGVSGLTMTDVLTEVELDTEAELQSQLTDVTDVFTNNDTITGSNLDLSEPGAIGGTTPSTGAFTTLSASGTISANGGTIDSTGNMTLDPSGAGGDVQISGDELNLNSSNNARILADGGGGQLTIAHEVATGTSVIRTNPDAQDGTSATAVDFFRETNTSGSKLFRIFKGDGTGTITAQITGEDGNFQTDGDADLDGGDINSTATTITIHPDSGSGTGNLLIDGNLLDINDTGTADGLVEVELENDAQRWSMRVVGSGSDHWILHDVTNNQNIVRVANNAGSDSLRITSTGVGIGAAPGTALDVDNGDIQMSTAGNGINIPEGSNARMGTATLSSGTATVNTTAVTANSRIMLTTQDDNGNVGDVHISARSAGTSFTITSDNGADDSEVAWIIFEPAS